MVGGDYRNIPPWMTEENLVKYEIAGMGWWIFLIPDFIGVPYIHWKVRRKTRLFKEMGEIDEKFGIRYGKTEA